MSNAGSYVSATASTLKYRAFISCSDADERWSRWLRRAIESYRVPKRLIGLGSREDPIPTRLRPVFHGGQRSSFSPGLSEEVRATLEQSACLVVICSPSAADSMRVNEEVLFFKRLGRENRILALIVDGEPNAGDKPGLGRVRECFPDALKHRFGSDGQLSGEISEPIAADVRREGDGKANAKLKLIAGLLGVGYEALKQRELEVQRRNVRNYQIIAASMALLVLFALSGGVLSYYYMLKSNASAEIAVATVSSFVEDLMKMSARMGVSQAMTESFLIATDRQLDSLYDKGVHKPRLRYERAMNLNNYAQYYGAIGDIARQRSCAEKSVALMRELARQDPSHDGIQRGLACSERTLGDALMAQGQFGPALNAYRESLTITQRLAAAHPSDAVLLSDISANDEEIGDVLAAQGELAPALISFRASFAIRQRLAASEPDNASRQSSLANCEERIGHVLGAQRQLGQALDYLRASEEIRLRLAKSDPDNAEGQRDLAVVEERIGDTLLAEGQLGSALESHHARLAIAQRLAASDPGNAEWADDVALAFAKVADVELQSDDAVSALVDYSRAQAILQKLVADSPESTKWRSHFDYVNSALRDIAQRLAADQLPGSLPTVNP